MTSSAWHAVRPGLLSILGVLWLAVFPCLAAAQEDEEDQSPHFRAGLIAQYNGADGSLARRLDERIAFVWQAQPPDRRLGAGEFRARWHGYLYVQNPGLHRLRVYAAGIVRLQLNGQTLLDDAAESPQWLHAQEIELPFGYHPLEVSYRSQGDTSRLGLYWSGPQFELEPVAERWLFHRAADTPDGRFQRGAELSAALRCSACHAIPGEAAPLSAPRLDRLGGNISAAWLTEWLVDSGKRDTSSETETAALRRMPHFEMSRADAEVIARYLTAPGMGSEPTTKTDDSPPGNREEGERLFRTIGCLACHRVGNLGADGLFGGGDLSRVADKRPAGFFAAWLANPAALNPDHRMPVFELSAEETGHLAAYLQTLKSSQGDAEPAIEPSPAATVEQQRAAALLQQYRCGACHGLPGEGAATKPIAISAGSDWQQSCLGEADGKMFRPGYRLSEEQRGAIEEYLITTIKSAAPFPSKRSGAELLAQSNCLACHARGSALGIRRLLPAVAESDPQLREQLPAMAAPALYDVGDKLHDAALLSAIQGRAPRRPWLKARMPRFRLSDEQWSVLQQHLIAVDRIPPLEEGRVAGRDEHTLRTAGARLVTADGFGCTSCHAIGKSKPQNVALHAIGPELSMLGQYVRRTWFERWTRNPARIAPRMEMPAVQQPIRGVLDERLDDQLAAVWQVLNTPDFNPPSPGALRVVRAANMRELGERCRVLTDVIEQGDRRFVKPLVIGLPNRHNLLFDLATNRLSHWWIGDTARQRTRGKTWYWEAAGSELLSTTQNLDSASAELALFQQNEWRAPVTSGQYPTEFDYFEHLPAGLRFGRRLRFGDQPATMLHIIETISPLWQEADGSSGFRRRIEIEGSSPSDKVRLRLLTGAKSQLAADRRTVMATASAGEVSVAVQTPGEVRFEPDAIGGFLLLQGSAEPIVCELDYRTRAAVDQFPPLPPLDRTQTRTSLDVVPGFDAMRLPLSDEIMPTGLAWLADGRLVLTSLEGRVWLGEDTDGDHLEDRLQAISDDLAAPYGVAVHGNAIDVINKYALLRLYDQDGDQSIDRTETIASGWGHTDDYHDWAVGLPSDAARNYYVALPCQQDDRSEAAAALRGTVVRLSPRQPDRDDPRRYTIAQLAGGMRFPMGLAFNQAGDLFATDNQGNYTPFNELNHLVPGQRYGFINKLEAKRGLTAPARNAAIEIPHPWTRSVNGICFLDTPAQVRERLGHDLFGLYEGHLIGCEYDTRRLVRMTLERVGDNYQGAVYPLSREPDGDAAKFEGPVVCQVAPDGDVYIGNMRDSGWGAGSNTGSLVRMSWNGDLPPGIARVSAVRGGFAIDFTQPVDAQAGAAAQNYAIASYRRIATPDYGGPDVDRRVERVTEVRLSADRRRSVVTLSELRPGFVYEIRVGDLIPGQKLFPSEAHYTLRVPVPPADR